MKILMVCLGNICRSPLAEGILKTKTQEKGLDWTIESAGTGSWHIGNPPDERSIAIAKKYDIDISEQRARQFVAEDFDKYDLIYALSTSNYQAILKHAREPEDMNHVKMIMNESRPGMNMSVPDPYWDNSFEQVYQLLDEACEAILKRLTVVS